LVKRVMPIVELVPLSCRIIKGRGGRVMTDKDAPDWLEEVLVTQHFAATERNKLNNWHYTLDKLFRGDNFGYYGPDVKFPNGYDTIFAAFAGDYEVRLSSRVERISLTDAGVEMEIQGQAVASFDAVIVTVPLGVLKKGVIAFNPSLPERKQGAIARLGMGTLDKVYLLFKEAFWDDDPTWIITPENDLPPGQFNNWLNLHRYLGVPIIMAFNGASPALDLAHLSDEEVVTRALRTLEIAYPV
ncbi:MAG: FAD-dependent oxidoreductase, partial [Cyanobacteria bacterium J06627_3]